MKASLCKLSPCTVTLVCDYHAKLFLIAISSTLKSLLRPHILNTPDKSPGDRLTEICAKITDVGGSCLHPAAPLRAAAHAQLCAVMCRIPPAHSPLGAACPAWEALALRAGLELGTDANQKGTKDEPCWGGAARGPVQVGPTDTGCPESWQWTLALGPALCSKLLCSAILSPCLFGVGLTSSGPAHVGCWWVIRGPGAKQGWSLCTVGPSHLTPLPFQISTRS